MKTSILFLLLLAAIVGKGQIQSYPKMITTDIPKHVLLFGDSTITSLSFRTDTIPAILLVGHPWKKDGHYTLDKNGFHPYIDSSFSSKVWQMRGYITYNQVVIYLDENKKPLEPGIIVWMAREW